MSNKIKYERQVGDFKSHRESLAFTPKDAGADTKARARAANTKTLLNNYQRQGDADLISMDLDFKQQDVVDRHNDRIADLSAKWHAQDLAAFSDILDYGFKHMAHREQRLDQEKAMKDYLKVLSDPELAKKVMPLYTANVRSHDKNIRSMTNLALSLKGQGETLGMVKRILDNGGHYSQTMRRLMKTHVIESLPEVLQQNLKEKVIIPDSVFPGLPEAISLEDISPDGEHQDPVSGDMKAGGKYYELIKDRDFDGSVEQYLNAAAKEKAILALGKSYGLEAVITDFEPHMAKYFGDRAIEGGERANKFFNSSLQKSLREVTVKEIKTLNPNDAVYELIQDVNAAAPYMNGHTQGFQTKLNQALIAYENRELTLQQLRALETAIVNAKDHDNIGFTGTKEFREWRHKDFDAVDWENRINQHILKAGKIAADKRSNAITSLQGMISQYKTANRKAPDRQLIEDWATTLDQNGESGGLSVAHMVEEATKNMSTQQGDTFDNMKKELTGAVAQSGGISAEVAANYPPEIVAWLEEKKWILDPAFEPDESAKGSFNKLLGALVKQSMKQEGAYDRPLTQELIEKNGADWLRKRYTELRIGGLPADKALGQSIEELQKEFDKDIEKWMVFKSSDTRTQDLTASASDEWQQNGFSFDSPLTALEDRLENIAVHLRSGGRIHKDLVYKAEDGNHYKVFDDTLTQLAARSGKTTAAILREQLAGMGVVVGLDGQFKYLNADRRTQYIMERGGSGQIRAEVNASIKDSHLEKLEINQDGGKNFYGIPILRLNERYLEEATGIDAAYLNTVEKDGFKGVMDKLGIKRHELLTPQHIKLIQKRVLSEHGASLLGTVDTEETGVSSFTYNAEEGNLTEGLSNVWTKEFNQEHFDTPMKITYASRRDRGTPIGATKTGPFGNILVFGIVSGSDTTKHLGWRDPKSQKPWVLELMKTEGRRYE